jgi:uncharacterized protein
MIQSRKLLAILFVMSIHTAVHAQAGSGPSFDCAKARSTPEQIICSDTELSRLDSELAEVYATAKAQAPDLEEFKRQAAAEWRFREQTCRDRACLVQWYEKRKLQLTAQLKETQTPSIVGPHPPSAEPAPAIQPEPAQLDVKPPELAGPQATGAADYKPEQPLALPLVESGAFSDGWYWWLPIGGFLTFWLPFRFLMSNPAGAIDELHSRITINKLFGRGEYNPVSTGLEATGSVLLGGLVTLVVGPLLIWINVVKPFLHEHDDSSRTLCCIEAPQPSADQRLIYDFFRDDPFFLWRFLKAILTGDGDGEWKLRIIDVHAGKFLNLSKLGQTEDSGSVLVLGKSDRTLEMAITPDQIVFKKWRTETPLLAVPAKTFGLAYWPTVKNQFEASGCSAEQANSGGGIFSGFTGLFKIIIASKDSFLCATGTAGSPAQSVSLFGGSQYWFTLKDSGVHVFKSGFSYIKFVKT